MKRKPLEPGKYFCFFFSVIFISCVLTGCSRRDDLFQEGSQEMADEEEFQITDQETANTQVPVSEAAITESAVLAEVSQEPEEIYVDVSGAVVSPGVYCLDAGSRIFQAIEAAGGCTTEAAPVCLNQAAELSDGQKVYVPTVQEAEAADVAAGNGAGGNAGYLWDLGTQSAVTEQMPDGTGQMPEDADQGAGTGKVNINTADKELLTTLPGVGSSKADAILAYRQEQGGFSSIEEIMNVEGIKEGVFARIKDRISVD